MRAQTEVHRVTNGARYEHLSRTGETSDASAEVRGHAGQVLPRVTHSQGVQTRPDH